MYGKIRGEKKIDIAALKRENRMNGGFVVLIYSNSYIGMMYRQIYMEY